MIAFQTERTNKLSVILSRVSEGEEMKSESNFYINYI